MRESWVVAMGMAEAEHQMALNKLAHIRRGVRIVNGREFNLQELEMFRSP
jgi:hypothetical protein